MKANRVITKEERLENIDEMLLQYIEVIFNLMENVLDLVEKRKKEEGDE